MYAKKFDAYLLIMLAEKGCVAPFNDPYMLSAQIMNIAFDLIARANRVALLLNWEDPSPHPDRFKTSMYGKRKGETNRFRVSEKALQFIYSYGEAYISDDEKPPCICAPLKFPDGRVFGVLYLDTKKPAGFEIKNMECLERIAGPAAKLLYCSFKQHKDREQMDSYRELPQEEPPATDMAARLSAMKRDVNYMKLADSVFESEGTLDWKIRLVRRQIESFIQAGDPPMFRDTFERLVRAGHPPTDATVLICTAVVSEYIGQAGKAPDGDALARALEQLPRFTEEIQ